MEQKKNTSPIQINDFKVIWRVISKNWYIPILVIPVLYLIGYFYQYKLANVYQASVSLLKSNDTYYKENLITDNSNYYAGGGQSYIDNSNEIRVITSFDLMKETVLKLKDRLHVSYYLVGRVRTTEQFNANPFSIKINNISPNLLETPIKFKIIDFDSYELSYLFNGAEVRKTGRFNEILLDIDLNILVQRESNLVKGSVEQLSKLDYQVVIHDLDNLVYNYQSALKVENPEYTNVLVITLNDILPERAILILDTLSRIYINKSVMSRFEINERTINFIDKQLNDVSSSLKEVEDTMQDYKKQHEILDLDWQKQDFFSKLSVYDGKKSALNLKISAVNDLEKYIIEDKDPQFLPPNVFLVDDDEFLKSSVSELYSTQIALSKLLSGSMENNPNVLELRQKIKKLKQNMLVYLSNTRSATLKIIENINGEVNSYVSDIKNIPQKQRDMLNIQRKVSVNEGLYNFLLQKKANTKIAKASIVPEIKVIDSSRNMGIVSPNKSKILSSFVSVGLAISLLIIIIRLAFFTTIQSLEELKEKTFLPVIADIPFQKNMVDVGFYVDENPSSYVAEAFRTLRTNLQYVILNSKKKVILVTSHRPSEGKTFTTISLATILANGGKKVVMLELDLHKPRIQKALNMNADKGISTFMVGQNTLDEIVKPTEIKNLYTILSGPIPPNPSDLVLSDKLKELMEYAKDNFDFVMIDTPPAGMLADASYLMQYSDINLFVLNTKFANNKVLNLFHKLTTDNSISNVYLVLNGVKRKRNKYYARYGYGYGYGYNNKV